jgi:hypothetical protein
MMEANEQRLANDHPLRALFLADRPGESPEWTFNLLLRHGVRSCLEYAKTRDLARARALSNPRSHPTWSSSILGLSLQGSLRRAAISGSCTFRDPQPDSVFVITAYTLEGKPLTAYKRRRGKK